MYIDYKARNLQSSIDNVARQNAFYIVDDSIFTKHRLQIYR